MKDTLRAIPAKLLPLLQGDAPVDNTETIRLYLISEEGAVELTDKQKKLLERYEFTDNIMRDRKNSYLAIEQLIQEKFNINVASARKAISIAQYLFGSTQSRNKHYLLSQHYDSLIEVYNNLIEAKEWKEAAAFGKLINEAIKQMPEDHRKNNKAAAIIFNLSQNNYIDLTGEQPNEAQAAATAAKYQDAEDIDHETV